jgi:methionyl-tRNA synthetase
MAKGKTCRLPEKIMSFYITTPIYYVNAQPHLGHAYSTIVADAIYRFKKLCGEESFFQTGTDEHGDKIAEAADQAGVSPKEYVDRISAQFQAAWPPLNINPDNFIRTTDPQHIATVQSILQQVYDQGDIYFDTYSGLYCQGCERFLTAKELLDGNCPDHLTPPKQINEENYFFRMGNYQEWLIDYIKKNPGFITPERYRNEVLAFLKEPLEDLCISRPTSRLTWGIPLPFDDRFVTYVWFDALINYLTGIGYPDGNNFARFWPAAEHIIAKDILKPHAIFWPTMLKSMGLAPYRKLHVHGYWNINETKMSKSIGNVVRPADLVTEFGVDPVRYFILREMSFGLDASFSTEGLIDRQNSDLAIDLGNLFSRSLTMINKFSNGTIPAAGEPEPEDADLAAAATGMVAEYSRHMNEFAFNRALQEVWKVISLANKYIVANAPWELAKDPANSKRLHTVLYHLAETLRLLALVLQPIMPETSEKMRQGLGFQDRQKDLLTFGHWGLTKPESKITLGPSLFPRVDMKKQKEKAPAALPQEQGDLQSFEDFMKFDLRVAEIIGAERINKSKRLLKLIVKAPEERTVVAGIAEHYDPEQIVGKQVIIVANLKPAKLMGVTSHGMVLAAKAHGTEGEHLVLSGVSEAVVPGSKVS